MVLPEALELWRASRLGQVTERVEQEIVFDLLGPPAGQRVLDTGCGDGTYAVAAAEHRAEVTAVDVSAQMLVVAKERAAQPARPSASITPMCATSWSRRGRSK